MKIWEIRADVENYEWLYISRDVQEIPDTQEIICFFGKSRIKHWKPIIVERMDENTSPELGNCANYSSNCAIDRKAIDVLQDLLEGNVELLPLIFDEKDYYVINVTNVVDCVDFEKSRYEKYTDDADSRIMDFDQYVFKEEVAKERTVFQPLVSGGHRNFV
jgi:hypothetical protein